MAELDVALLRLLNGLGGHSPLFDNLVRAVVNDYAVPTLFALIIGGLWLDGATEAERERNQRAVLYAILGVALVNLLIRIGWSVYFRPRPFATLDVHLLFYRPSVSSFPSEPVATLIAFATGVWLLNRRVGRWMYVLAAAFALARVIAGVHYPSDIVAGAALGFLAVYLPFQRAEWFDRPMLVIVRLARRLNLA